MLDPRAGAPTRDLIEHAVRGELGQLVALMTKLGPERVAACLMLCLRVSGYVAIDLAGPRWPTEADLREIARRTAAADLDFNLEEPDAYAFLARAAIGFEPLFDVFPGQEGRAVMVPILTTAALLACDQGSPRPWREHLDTIEQALGQVTPRPEAGETVPAVLLWSRCRDAVENRKSGERTARV